MPLDITEYTDLPADSRGNSVPTGLEPSRRVQQLAIGGASQRSLPLEGVTRFVRIHADSTCRIAFGLDDSIEASSASQRLPAGATEFYGVRPGTRIAVIQST